MTAPDTVAIAGVTQLFSLADGKPQPATFDELIGAARAAITIRFTPGVLLNSPALMKNFVRLRFATSDRESFILILVDTQNRLNNVEEIARGTIDHAAVYPREVVMSVLRHNAKAIFAVHNHPSGEAEPSGADRLLTQRLINALAPIDVRLVDHFVVGGDRITSFAERGWI